MTRLFTSLFVVFLCLLLIVPAPVSAQRRRGGGACPANLNTIEKCPVEGCGGTGTDFKLNRAKNRITPPATADIIDMTLDDLREMEQPNEWEPNQSRKDIQGQGQEGQPVRVMGFLKFAKREHRESCNCKLDAEGEAGELLTDIHMVLTDNFNDPEATSITAEITPRVRARRPNPVTWTRSQIVLLRKKFIRVTGFLMLDTQHINSPLVRATNWEVHPITKLEVCTASVAECKQGTGWQNVP